MSKILCIGDPHCKISNIASINKIALDVVDIVGKNDIDFIVILGDLHDTHNEIKTQSLNAMYHMLKSISQAKKTYLLVGNHCLINNQHVLTPDNVGKISESGHFFNVFSEIENLSIIDHPQKINDFIFTPYTPPGKFMETLRLFLKEDEITSAKAIFCHQEFYGSSFGTIVSSIGDKWPSNMPVAISGHIHEYCRLQENILYVGTPFQTTFAETDDKAYLVTNFSENFTYSRIKTNFPRKFTLELTLEDAIALNIDAKDGDTIRVFINDTSENIEKAKNNKKLQKKLENCKVIYNKTDKSKVIRNAANHSYTDLINKYSEKEPEHVKSTIQECIKEAGF